MADLTTADRVKAQLGITSNETDDVLAFLVSVISTQVTAAVRRSFSAAAPPTHAVTETRNGDGETRIILNDSPAVSVTSVTIDGETIPARATVDGEGWVKDGDSVELVGYRFGRGVQNVVIVYTAGAAVPADLEYAVIQLVGLAFEERKRIGQASMSAAGFSVSYLPSMWPRSVEQTINRYRRIWPA